MKKKYLFTLIIIGIGVVASIGLGVSYALWQITAHQKEENLVKAGCLKIEFVDVTDSIQLTNSYPIKDSEGLASTPYKFRIKNDCSLDAKYYVTLNTITNTTMLESSIKYALGLGNATPTVGLLSDATINTETSNFDIDNLAQSFIISEENTLRIGETKEYSLYLWMDEAVTVAEASKKFEALVAVTAVATNNLPVIANLAVAPKEGNLATHFLSTTLPKNKIESLVFVDSNIIPNDVLGSWDVSEQQNAGINLWYYDSDNNGLYELYIGQAGGVIANTDSSYLFNYLSYLERLDLTHFKTYGVTDMKMMFTGAGTISTRFTLDLGPDFDTSSVTTMEAMFASAASKSVNFTIDLGSKFNTSNVTNMRAMFYFFASDSTVFTLDLGSHFNTSKVTNMGSMFHYTGSNSLNFILDLGMKFDTSNVIIMNEMFSSTGKLNPNFSINFGPLFDTSKVTDMDHIFYETGRANRSLILDLRTFTFPASINRNDFLFESGPTFYLKDTANYNILYPFTQSGNSLSGVNLIDCSMTSCPQ